MVDSVDISEDNMADADPVQSVGEGSRMSSLSRRACYKCGNVGHYAEVCSSSERLCYNCKQPGGSKDRAIYRANTHSLTAFRA